MLATIGRTVRTFRDAVSIEEQRWKQIRRTLRPAGREALDWIFNAASRHGDAVTMYTAPRMSVVTILLALIEIIKRLAVIEERLPALGSSSRSKPTRPDDEDARLVFEPWGLGWLQGPIKQGDPRNTVLTLDLQHALPDTDAQPVRA